MTETAFSKNFLAFFAVILTLFLVRNVLFFRNVSQVYAVGSPTATPEIRVNIKNENGGNLAIKQICRANCDSTRCTETLCRSNTASYAGPNIFGNSPNKRGAWIVKKKASN